MELVDCTETIKFLNRIPIKRQHCYHIETSQLISRANQLTGFYMMATLAFNELICDKTSAHSLQQMNFRPTNFVIGFRIRRQISLLIFSEFERII